MAYCGGFDERKSIDSTVNCRSVEKSVLNSVPLRGTLYRSVSHISLPVESAVIIDGDTIAVL